MGEQRGVINDNGYCMACGSFVGTPEQREADRIEWERINAMTPEEIDAELAEAGIDVDKSYKFTKLLTKVCVDRNVLKRKQKCYEETCEKLKVLIPKLGRVWSTKAHALLEELTDDKRGED